MVVLDKSPAQVEDHDKWWRKLTELRRKQRVELQQWKLRRDEEEGRRRQCDASGAQDVGRDIHQWVRNWNQQRHIVQHKLERWKVSCVYSSIVDLCLLLVQSLVPMVLNQFSGFKTSTLS